MSLGSRNGLEVGVRLESWWPLHATVYLSKSHRSLCGDCGSYPGHVVSYTSMFRRKTEQNRASVPGSQSCSAQAPACCIVCRHCLYARICINKWSKILTKGRIALFSPLVAVNGFVWTCKTILHRPCKYIHFSSRLKSSS